MSWHFSAKRTKKMKLVKVVRTAWCSCPMNGIKNKANSTKNMVKRIDVAFD